ncbi:hypothetical protein PENTCL1PPCAC_22036, partial [Pristionchus entomophagus]
HEQIDGLSQSVSLSALAHVECLDARRELVQKDRHSDCVGHLPLGTLRDVFAELEVLARLLVEDVVLVEPLDGVHVLHALERTRRR